MGWEWVEKVGLEEFKWVIEIFGRMRDNRDRYEFVFYED